MGKRPEHGARRWRPGDKMKTVKFRRMRPYAAREATFDLAGLSAPGTLAAVSMRLPLIAFLLWLVTPLAAVEVGTARVNVLQELGPPAAALKRGDTETLSYKDGTKVVLKNGRVVEFTGPKTAEPAAVAPAAQGKPAAGEPAEEPEDPPLTKEQAAELDKLEKAAADADAKARAEMEKAILELENMAEAEPEPYVFDVIRFLIELGVKWVMTLAALKLACKYWNSDVSWNGLMLVAIVDTVIRGIIGYIGYELMDMMSLFYADEAVAAFVMIGLLRKVSINQRLALAVEVMFTTKVFSIVVGSLVVTVLMRVLF
jgi:hypothetical protein